MMMWRRAIVLCLLMAIPLGTSTGAYTHVHPDHRHAPNHHDGAQSHRHAPDDAAPAGEHDDAVTLGHASMGIPGSVQAAPVDSAVGAPGPTPEPSPWRPALTPSGLVSLDQSPPGDPPVRPSFERGPPR